MEIRDYFTGERIAMDQIDIERQAENDRRRNENEHTVEKSFAHDVPLDRRALMERTILEDANQLVIDPRSGGKDGDANQTQTPFENLQKERFGTSKDFVRRNKRLIIVIGDIVDASKIVETVADRRCH